MDYATLSSKELKDRIDAGLTMADLRELRQISKHVGSAMHRYRMARAVQLAIDAMATDGAHHKQWYLEQIVRVLNPKANEATFADFEEGIAP